jgi:Zn-dependent oligopeptidase
MWVSLQDKTNPNNYSETSKVNPAGIRLKEYILNWGGLTDVWMLFSEARSNACCEKSADDIVPEKKKSTIGEGQNFI